MMDDFTESILQGIFFDGYTDHQEILERLRKVTEKFQFDIVFYSIGHCQNAEEPNIFEVQTIKKIGSIPTDFDSSFPIRAGMEELLPFTWNDEALIDRYINEEKCELEKSLPVLGLTFPFVKRGANGGAIRTAMHIGSVSLNESEFHEAVEKHKDELYNLCGICDLALQQHCLTSFYPLTQLEIDILNDFSRLRQVNSIAKQCNKTPRSVQLCLQSARKKLQAMDNAHATDIAQDLGFIE